MGKIVDACIDDMVIKSKKELNHMKDLTEVSSILKEHRLRLSTTKCAFWVRLGKFLGHLVTRRGIEVNPKQIVAINYLVLRIAKEVQKLTRMVATCNPFISKSSDKCHPFFLLIHKNTNFLWNEECELAPNSSRNI